MSTSTAVATQGVAASQRGSVYATSSATAVMAKRREAAAAWEAALAEEAGVAGDVAAIGDELVAWLRTEILDGHPRPTGNDALRQVMAQLLIAYSRCQDARLRRLVRAYDLRVRARELQEKAARWGGGLVTSVPPLLPATTGISRAAIEEALTAAGLPRRPLAVVTEPVTVADVLAAAATEELPVVPAAPPTPVPLAAVPANGAARERPARVRKAAAKAPRRASAK